MSKFLILVLLLDTILNLLSLFKITRSDFFTLFLRSELQIPISNRHAELDSASYPAVSNF